MTGVLYNFFVGDYDKSYEHYKKLDSSKEDLHLKIADYVEWFFGVCSVGCAIANAFSGIVWMQAKNNDMMAQNLKTAGYDALLGKVLVGTLTGGAIIPDSGAINTLPYLSSAFKITACATVFTFLLFKVAHAISDYLHNRSVTKTFATK